MSKKVIVFNPNPNNQALASEYVAALQANGALYQFITNTCSVDEVLEVARKAQVSVLIV